MKKVLVTGGAGFVGSHLLEKLVKNPDYDITVIDDLSTGKINNIKPFFYNCQLIICEVQNLVVTKKFDIIYHLAAKANTRATGLVEFEDNIMATEAVVKMLKPNGRIIFSSSCAVYGNQQEVTEQSPFQPISPYGYSKWMGELIIKEKCENWTIFRFSNVFGERQDGSTEMGLIGVINYNLKNNTTMKVFNKGENERDYIYVKDVVRALINVHKKAIFQVGSNKCYKTIDLIKLSGVKYTMGKTNNEVNKIKLDNSKLLKLVGWKSTLSVTQYIRRLKNV